MSQTEDLSQFPESFQNIAVQHFQFKGDSSEILQHTRIINSFIFNAAADQSKLENGVNVKIASSEDLGSIIEIQKNSPSDPSIRLLDSQIAKLIDNHQVLIAKTNTDKGQLAAGAIFFTSSYMPDTYAKAIDPANYAPLAPYIYDFWIIVHKDRAKAVDKTSVSDSLISASASLANDLNKQGVIAYSRAGNALLKYYSMLCKYLGSEDLTNVLNFLDQKPAFKGQLILNYAFTSAKSAGVGRYQPEHFNPLVAEDLNRKSAIVSFISKNIKSAYPEASSAYFTNWLRENYSEVFDQEALSILERPDPSALWNPFENQFFIPLAGALFRKFCDQGEFAPIDPALGRLHTRLGARLSGVILDSRKSDINALGSNVLMSYEIYDNIDKLILKLISGYQINNNLSRSA